MDRPATPLWLRWAGIVLGVLFLFWLPIEDVQVYYVLGLSGGACAWAAARYLASRWGELSRGRVMLAGGAAGLLAPLAAVGLMLFKSGVHAHGFLDFPGSQIVQVLQSAPWWAVLGIIVSSFASLLSKNS